MEVKEIKENKDSEQGTSKNEKILEFKKRMLVWNNPVEYVNNMYGSHPDNDGDDKDGPDYFKKVFSE